ncbi:venom serine protease 34-like [Cotesia typhae]|uniref:venom serine protease 34-like n=1 Tax=Cotesia typhae TaxID=2053667 RepID=UPI003D6803C9
MQTVGRVLAAVPHGSCGWTNPTRIVGGRETKVNEYPMMAGIIDINGQYLICGATIINQKQVITAASCVYNKDLSNTAVIVDDHDVTTDKFGYKGKETDALKSFRPMRINVHPGFSPKTIDNDIAVVIIDATFKFYQLVGPACLPFLHSTDSFEKRHVYFGGPVLWRNPETKRMILVVLIDYGMTCSTGSPSVNTDISYYVDWIVSKKPPEWQYCTSE